MKPITNTLAAFCFLVAPLAAGAGTAFQPGSILISSDNTLYEYTADGQLVSETAIPLNSTGETARDVVILDDGRLAVFNGTFSPELAIYDGADWSSRSIAGWSTPNNLSYGGIAGLGDRVFLTDGSTGGGETQGLIAVDLNANTSDRFIDSSNYIDITLGHDGLLYALRNVYGDVDVVDPETLTVTRSVDLGHTSASRGVAANADGDIYMASWSGYIAHYDATGTLLNTLDIGGSLQDIDLDTDGRLVVGSRFGQAYLSDETLGTFTEIDAADSSTFVAFVPAEQAPAVPELSGRHFSFWRWVFTTLTWSTDAEAVDVYRNGDLIDTVGSAGTATYYTRAGNTPSYMVCNAGTSYCSEPYVAD